jgi:ketosteroid isomerase-like protein
MNAHQTPSTNLATVQSAYQAFSRGDVAAIIALCAPDIDWKSNGSADDFPTLGPRRGRDGVAEFFRLVAQHDSFTSFEPLSFDAAGDKVFVEGHYGITATATGRHFESDWLHVFTIHDGLATRWREFTDTAAFAAAFRR